ncbi:MAG: hypothetical protein AAFX44_13450 [Pseudomonadota bacterium]
MDDRYRGFWFVAVLSLGLAACGGGSTGSTGGTPGTGDTGGTPPAPGAISFAKSYGTEGSEIPVPSFKTSDGGFLLVNRGRVPVSGSKADVTKLDAAGDVVWSTVISDTGTQPDFFMSNMAITRDGRGKTWLAGETWFGEIRAVRLADDGTEEFRAGFRLSNFEAFGLAPDAVLAEDPDWLIVDDIAPAANGGVHIGGRMGLRAAFTTSTGALRTERRRAWFIVSLRADGTLYREWYQRRPNFGYSNKMQLAESDRGGATLYAAMLSNGSVPRSSDTESTFELFAIVDSRTERSQTITSRQPENLRLDELTVLSNESGGRVLATLSTSRGNHWATSSPSTQFYVTGRDRLYQCRGGWGTAQTPPNFQRCMDLPSYRDQTFVRIFEPLNLALESTATFNARGSVQFYESCQPPAPCKLVVLKGHAYDEMNPQTPLSRPAGDPNATAICRADLTTPDITLSSMTTDLTALVDSEQHCRFYSDRGVSAFNRAWDWRAAPSAGSPPGYNDFLLFSDPLLLPTIDRYDAQSDSWSPSVPNPGIPAGFLVTMFDRDARIDSLTEIDANLEELRYSGGFIRAADGDPVIVYISSRLIDFDGHRSADGRIRRYDGFAEPAASSLVFEYSDGRLNQGAENVALREVLGAVQTADGGYVIGFAGRVSGFGDQQSRQALVLAKLDRDGGLDWKRAYAGLANLVSDFAAESDDGFSGYFGRLFIRFDTSGAIVEQRPYGVDDRIQGQLNEVSTAEVIQLGDGRDASIATSTAEFGDDGGSFLTLYDALDPTDAVRLEFPALYSSITETDDGGVVLGGFSPELAAYQLTKVDGQGVIVWSHTYGEARFTPSEQPADRWRGPLTRVRTTSDGGFVFAFTVVSSEAGEDAVIVRTDARGRALWWRRYGSATDESVSGLAVTDDGGLLLTAKTLMNHTLPVGPSFRDREDRFQDNWLLRLGADGDLTSSCNARLDAGSDRIDAPAAADARAVTVSLPTDVAPTALPAEADPNLAVGPNVADPLIVARQCSAPFTTDPGFTPIIDNPTSLTVTQIGSGTGVVRSTPNGIRCSAASDPLSDCTEIWNRGQVVELNVDPGDIGNFVGWQGCDAVADNLGTGDRCTVTLDRNRDVFVDFAAPPAPPPGNGFRLEFTSVGPDGYVSASIEGGDEGSDGILCRTDDPTRFNDCTAIIAPGTRVFFRVQALNDFNAFLSWGGDCADLNGQGTDPEIIMDRDRTCTAEFSQDTHIRLNYTIEGPPGTTDQPRTIGFLATNPMGRECRFHPGVCLGWPAGTGPVDLTAVPTTSRRPWLFHSWGGECGREVLNAAGGDLKAVDRRTITLNMQQSYPTCIANFSTNVTRAVVDVNFPNVANITRVLVSTGQPSTTAAHTCRDDCELARLGDASTGSAMDLVVENIGVQYQFDGWNGCDVVFNDAAVSPLPICRIGANGYGVFEIGATFSRR